MGEGDLPPRFLAHSLWQEIQKGFCFSASLEDSGLTAPQVSREAVSMFLRRNLGDSFSPLLIGSLSLLLAILLWQTIAWISNLPAFILPSPVEVMMRFVRAVQSGTLLPHLWATLSEILLGLLLGAFTATILGYLIAHSSLLEHFLSPYLVASQAIPMVALAPLLVIWFGPGMFSKVLICTLIVFFPILINTVIGIRNIPRPFYDLMYALHATRWQVLLHVELPASLPIFFGGLRVGATLSVIGAVVGELVGADRGLGFLINVARGQYDTALVFTSILTLIALALALYGMVSLLEHGLIRGR